MELLVTEPDDKNSLQFFNYLCHMDFFLTCVAVVNKLNMMDINILIGSYF